MMSKPTIGSANGKAGEHAQGAGDDGQRGEAVGAGVLAVGDQGRRSDPAPDADAINGNQLVAGETDEPGGDEYADIGHRLRARSAGGSTRSRR